MSDQVLDLHGVRVLLCAADGPRLASERDATDVIGDAFGGQAQMIALPVSRLSEDFLDLRTRIAGEVIQKFVTYGLRLAIVGDIAAPLAASKALRDFVYESNRGRHVWFVADMDALAEKLAQAAA